ncbi:hypothetical protein [Rhizohabitans arisaemae]|uniref:hypothetical protein n=1 Tax=Rhizohabitans arisaemae TaxID=2720610 RepID=UPI0024B04ECA|nr:hypothetical protein [Rhizohabitans arisaemae]
MNGHAVPGLIAERMRAAHAHGRRALHAALEPDAVPAWGWRGRTLGLPVTTAAGASWLRLACHPLDQADLTFFNGNLDAETAIPPSVPRLRLLGWHDWAEAPFRYRAELYERAASRPIADNPVLRDALDVPSSWWNDVRAALAAVEQVPTRRFTVHQHWLGYIMPRHLGAGVDTRVSAWSTAHGDFHFANVCGPQLLILDWEGWGLAPVGYDAAVLHTNSLLQPSAAASIRRSLPVLDTPEGRFAELVAVSELLHNNGGHDVGNEFVGAVHARAKQLYTATPCQRPPAWPSRRPRPPPEGGLRQDLRSSSP